MSSWTDICRDKNGGMKCDSADACRSCKEQAARLMTDRLLSLTPHSKEQKDG